MSHCHTTADITADTEPGDCSEASAAVLQYICQVSPFMIRDSGCCQLSVLSPGNTPSSAYLWRGRRTSACGRGRCTAGSPARTDSAASCSWPEPGRGRGRPPGHRGSWWGTLHHGWLTLQGYTMAGSHYSHNAGHCTTGGR